MINLVVLNGRVGADAEGRETASGFVSTFSIANTKKFKTKDGKSVEKTIWRRCVWWGNGARALNEYITKGRDVTVYGEQADNTWTDTEGKQQTRQEISVTGLDLHGGNGDGNGGGGGKFDFSKLRMETSEDADDYSNYSEDDDVMPWMKEG